MNLESSVSMASPVKIMELPLFSLEDLRSRWLLARVCALEKTLRLESRAGTRSIDELVLYEEELLNQPMTDEDKDALLRTVFDHSRKLGMSLVRYLNHSFELTDLAEILPHLGSPCFTKTWKAHHQAFVLSRPGCAANPDKKSLHCDYWREALDGFVMGVGTDERLARHRSQGHGDPDCEDILFMESESKEFIGGGVSRWGSLPEPLATQLEVQAITFKQKGFNLMVHGYSEGKLFYEMKAKSTGNCGPGERMMADHFEARLMQKFPQLKFSEISPQSVLDHKAP